MALRAEHPSKAFSHDLRSIRRDLVNAIDHYAPPMHPDINHLNRTVLSNPHSEQTCNNNVSGSWKRKSSTTMDQNLIQQPARLPESASLTSTSGRPMMPITTSPLAQDLYAHLYQYNVEIDTIVRRHNERLRLGVEESRKRQCRAVISTMLESQVMKRLREKETELEVANRKNAELEEKIRQMSTENQIWFELAKNNEAIASSLMSSLEQLHNSANVANIVGGGDDKEGYGDSDGTVPAAGDVQSCCFEGDGAADVDAAARRSTRVCRVCCDKDVTVLLLPCRHLCLCKECESKIEACPVCLRNKDACLQVFMSCS
ncbi:putative BOI-related E3 ubiquitin-protein ligase 3 [Iris pallida]|uniref:BOI-related E3 ubiquitin-protein ligase 3 n=1 Tax=Iris pallida TaxID=29817 RepID=A0AAX6HX76_IRIPA|nr:putative BOI-related E3 ubiquitin-protein ligase 3 [Iris pallida]